TLYDVNGFWDSLIALLDDLQQKGMIRGDYHEYIHVKHIDSLNQ
ncbi:MAG: TIGR00730 family Rossman fold protein, partial [Prevotella histicola]|nr:TIGR00730 family Rossman fold protein [Prevotella histicola]